MVKNEIHEQNHTPRENKKRSMYPFTLDENVKQNRHHYTGPVTYELKELYQEKF